MKFKIPLQIIDLGEDNYHLVVTSVLTNGETGFWVVDTGASKTVFDKSLAQKFGLTEIGGNFQTAGIIEFPMQVNTAFLPYTSFRNFKVDRLEVALIDLSGINALYQKSSKIEVCGLLGSDFLLKYNALIDYKRKVMILFG